MSEYHLLYNIILNYHPHLISTFTSIYIKFSCWLNHYSIVSLMPTIFLHILLYMALLFHSVIYKVFKSSLTLSILLSPGFSFFSQLVLHSNPVLSFCSFPSFPPVQAILIFVFLKRQLLKALQIWWQFPHLFFFLIHFQYSYHHISFFKF